MSRSRAALLTLVIALLPTALIPSNVAAGKLSGAVEAGFDSFNEQYTIVERDTLSQLNEFSTRLHLRYLSGSMFGNHVMLEGRGMFGGQSFENMARAAFMYRGTKNRVFADASVTGREYREDTQYSFPNDFIRYNARAYYQRNLTSALSVRLTNRFEAVNFDQRTEFDYDYYLDRVVLSTSLDQGLTTGYQLLLGYTRKEIPDSTAIAYDAGTLAFEYRRTVGLHKQLFISAQSERREYEDPLTRSPYWSALVLANLQPFVLGNFGAGVDFAGETYRYDQNTTAYFDFTETKTYAFLSYFRGLTWTVRLGPEVGFLMSNASPQDEYYDFAARLTIDYMSGDRMWLSASYAPGYRDYLFTASTPEEQIFSDFTYHAVSLMMTARILPQTNLNLFVDYKPEDHEVRGDDAMSALFAVNVAYSF